MLHRPRGRPGDGCAGRNILDHDRVRANLGAGPDPDRTDHPGAGADMDVVLDHRAAEVPSSQPAVTNGAITTPAPICTSPSTTTWPCMM